MADPIHKKIRDTIQSVLGTALGSHGIILQIHVQDEPGKPSMPAKPCAIIAYYGAEQEVGGTNLRDDWSFPIHIGLYTLDAANDPPGCSATLFRQVVRQAFHNKRLAGVDEVWLCQVAPQGPVTDDDPEAFDDLRTGMVVNAIARLGRG